MRVRRIVGVGTVAVGVLALAALPAQAYTSDPFYLLCRANTGAYAVGIQGDWHRAKTTVNLANALITNNSGRAYVIVSSHWEDLKTGQVQRGYTGYVPNGHTLPASGNWDTTLWLNKGDPIRWAVTGYADTNHSQVLRGCAVTP